MFYVLFGQLRVKANINNIYVMIGKMGGGGVLISTNFRTDSFIPGLSQQVSGKYQDVPGKTSIFLV